MAGRINRNPDMKSLYDELQRQIDDLRNKRFQVPVLTTDPTHPLPNDMWYNSTSNLLKVVNAAGTIKTVALT